MKHIADEKLQEMAEHLEKQGGKSFVIEYNDEYNHVLDCDECEARWNAASVAAAQSNRLTL